MRSEQPKFEVVEEKDVMVPDAYRALALGLDPQAWADAQVQILASDGANQEKALRMASALHVGYMDPVLDLGSTQVSPAVQDQWKEIPDR